MATIQTNIANTMDDSVGVEQLDEVAKKLVKYKSILAWILKECVE